MHRKIITEIMALLFVLVFLYAGLNKLLDFTLFREQIATMPVFESVAGWIAWSLPAAEFAVCVLLLVPRWRLKGFYAAFALMMIFTAYIVIILNIDKTLPCSCGGILESLSWKSHLVFNGTLLGISIAAIFMEKQNMRSEPDSGSSYNINFSGKNNTHHKEVTK